MEYFEEHNIEEAFDFKKLIYKSLSIWYIFIITICLSFVIAYIINRLSEPVYKAQTTILIYEDPSTINPESLIGINLYQNPKKIKNEIAILQSYSLTKKAIEKLNFEISYFDETKYPSKELYSSSPFIIVFDNLHPQIIGSEFKIHLLSDSSFVISLSEEEPVLYGFQNNQIIAKLSEIDILDTLSFDQLYENELFSFRIIKSQYFNPDCIDKNFSVIFNSKQALISKYRNVEIDYDKESSVIIVTRKGYNIEKTVKYLNTLIEVYLEREVEKKNQIAVKTLSFIDRQLNEILDSLNSSERLLQNFRSTNRIMNVDWQTEQVFSRMEELQDEKAELLVKTKYYKYIKEYLIGNDNIEELIAPSAIGINDPLLNKLIINLTTLYGEKSELLANSVKTNPYLNSIEIQIKSTKQSLLENIENIIAASNISLSEIDKRINNIASQMNELPRTQRELFGFERKFKLNDAIYTFLLQKRSETQIAKASNLPINEVLDPAMVVNSNPVYPKKRLNYILALLIGFSLPVLYILLKDYFNDKITDLDDINKLTNYPVLGYIIHNNNISNSVVEEYPLSSIAESFRSIRTNFQFITGKKKSYVVLITSSMKGEGKSFTSLNMASSFALNNKKTVLLIFDLRNPKLYMPLENSIQLGLSNYLVGNNSADDITQKTHIENLDLIHSGPIPPNPTELISTGRTGELFTELKSKYEYIIIDTPPIGIVSDFLLLIKYSDINLFLVRHNYTPAKMLKQILSDFENRKIPINLIVNDISFKNSYLEYRYGYGYGYGYGYSYGYGYGSDKNNGKSSSYRDEKRPKTYFSKLFSIQNFKSNFNIF